MTMLEATIHKNCRLVLWQDDIRCTRQFSALHTETQSSRENILRTIISGFVSFPLTAAIFRLRSDATTVLESE